MLNSTDPQDCLERRPEARPTAKEAFMRIKSSNLRTQSFDPEDEAPLPAGAPLPPVLKRGVSRLSDLQARPLFIPGPELPIAHVARCSEFCHFVACGTRTTLSATQP